MFRLIVNFCLISFLVSVWAKHSIKSDINCINCANSSQTLSHNTSNEENYRTFREIYAKISDNLKPIEWKLNESVFEFFRSVKISDKCRNSLMRWSRALTRGEFWAYECTKSPCLFQILKEFL